MVTRAETRPLVVDATVTRGESTLAATAGVVVTRVLFPVWLLTGAVLKLVDMSPANLPAALVIWLGGLGVDLAFVLRYSIAVELLVVAVVWMLPRLARPVALAMLLAFVPVLVGDLLLGASSCGCFGAVQIPPWATLAMDLTLLGGVWWLGGKAESLRVEGTLPLGRSLAVGMLALIGFAVAFGVPAPVNAPSAEVAPLPAAGFYMPDYEGWIGKRWQDLDLASWVSGMPAGLASGRHYLVFYRKDCGHCHELLDSFFVDQLPAPTTVVAVPERTGHPTAGVKPMPCEACTRAELPAGCDWFFKTPVMVRLQDGVVECAGEVDASAPDCLVW